MKQRKGKKQGKKLEKKLELVKKALATWVPWLYVGGSRVHLVAVYEHGVYE